MFRWRKLGRVFIPQEHTSRTWLKEFSQAPSVLLMENALRVYFSCRPPADRNGQYVSYTAYVDLELDYLFKIQKVSDKPILELGGLGEFDEFGIYPASIIRDDVKLRAYYAGWTRCESVPFNVAIGVAESLDNGETFVKVGSGPVLSYSLDEPFVLSGPKIRKYNNKWYLFYIAGRKWKMVNSRAEPVYKIRLAISDDGINWVKLNKDLIESKVEEDEAQASPDVFYSNGKYHMFFCYRYSAYYRGKQYGYRIGYAYSYDLLNWSRDDSKAGIDVSDNGWDSEMISYPHVFEVNDNIYMAYLGNEVGRFGFGIAMLEGSLE